MSFLGMFQYFWSLPYLRWEIIFIFIPLVFFFLFFRKVVFSYKKTLLAVVVGSVVWGFLFDQVASVWLHAWFFETGPNLKIYFFGLPLEEYFFLVFVPLELGILFLLVRKVMYRG